MNKLKSVGVTTILTVEKDRGESGSIGSYGVEEFVASNVITLETHNDNIRNEKINEIQILKLRGTSHETKRIPYLIHSNGIRIFPDMNPQYDSEVSNERFTTGISELDTMTEGGYLKGSSILISGTSGTGKTLLSYQVAFANAQKGVRVLYVSFEESEDQIKRDANSFGWDLQRLIDEGMLKILSLNPNRRYIHELMYAVKDSAEGFGPSILIIDSISTPENIFDVGSSTKFVTQIAMFIAFARKMMITTIFTYASRSLAGGMNITGANISNFMDSVIVLQYVETKSELRHALFVMKMRGTRHDKALREFTFTDTGIVVGDQFSDLENITGGNARGTDNLTKEELSDIKLTLDGSSLVAETDIDGTITYVNDKFVEISKYTREELIGQNHRMLKSGFHSPEFFASLWQTITSGTTWRADIRNTAKDGSIYWVRSTIMPAFGKEGKIKSYIAVRTPITDLMQPYENAIQAQYRGEDVGQEMNELLDELRSGNYNKYHFYDR